MNPGSVGPLSRPLALGRISPQGSDVTVEANEAERAALAADLGLPAIHALTGRFRVTGTQDDLRVAGTVRAEIEQTCVVTLEPFPSRVEEEVALEFRVPDRRRRAAEIDLDPAEDGPEELAGDSIDLGAITAEFLALGLDPYPRKPGAAFEQPEGQEAVETPFAGLAALRPKGGS